MASSGFHAYSYEYSDASWDDFVSSPDDIRTVYIIRFDPLKREVSAQIRWSGPYNRQQIENGEITATEEELLNSGEISDECDDYILPPPLVKASALKCECGKSCKIRVYRRAGKPEREQAICANGKCKCKIWVDIAHIRCRCGKPAVLAKASGRTKPENKGKEYFGCPRKTRESKYGCGYFEWRKDLEPMLSKDWGKAYMSVDEALQILVKRYKDDTKALQKMPPKVLSTLVGYCSQVSGKSRN